jgi:hypothetical protein
MTSYGYSPAGYIVFMFKIMSSYGYSHSAYIVFKVHECGLLRLITLCELCFEVQEYGLLRLLTLYGHCPWGRSRSGLEPRVTHPLRTLSLGSVQKWLGAWAAHRAVPPTHTRRRDYEEDKSGVGSLDKKGGEEDAVFC